MKPFYCFLVVTYVTNFVLGLIGNTLVLIYLYDSLKKSNQFNKNLAYILLNLGLADTLTEIFGVISVLFEYEVFPHPEGVFGDVFCKIITTHTLTWSFTNVSVMTVVLLAWERYRAVTQFKSKAASDLDETGYIRYIIGAFWIIGPGLYSPFVPFQVYSKANGCHEQFPNMASKYAVSLVDVICFYFGPFIFFLYTYSSIVRALKRPPKKFSDRRKQFSYNKVRRKLTRTAILIVGGFFGCWSGAYIIYTVGVLGNIDTVAMDTAYEISLIFAYFASTSHPIIYSFQSRHFRNKVKDIFEETPIGSCWLALTSCCQEPKIEPVFKPYIIKRMEETAEDNIDENETKEIVSNKTTPDDSKCEEVFDSTL